MIRTIPGNLQLHGSRACQIGFAACSTLIWASASSSSSSVASLPSAPPANLPDGPALLTQVLPSDHSGRISIKPQQLSIACRHECACLGVLVRRSGTCTAATSMPTRASHAYSGPASDHSGRISIKLQELSVVCRHNWACLECPWGGAQQPAHDSNLRTTLQPHSRQPKPPALSCRIFCTCDANGQAARSLLFMTHQALVHKGSHTTHVTLPHEVLHRGNGNAAKPTVQSNRL